MSKLVLKNTAATYDEVYGGGYDKSYPTTDLVRLESWFFKNKPGKALDYGCGPGTNGMHLLDSGYGVMFTDLVPEALNRVKEKLAKRSGISDRAETRTVDRDGDNIPDEAETYDYVICLSMISNLGSAENVRHLISEFHRVLKPGGKMIIDINGPASIGTDDRSGDLFEDKLVRYVPKSSEEFSELVLSIPGIEIDEIGFTTFRYQGRNEHEYILCAHKSS
jgi:SAM-dependent methyltransferase